MQDSLAAALVTRSLPMALKPFVQCRVTPEMKTLLRVLAEREQITESALVRQLLEVMLRTVRRRRGSRSSRLWRR